MYHNIILLDIIKMIAEESSPPVPQKWANSKWYRWRFLKRFSTDEDARKLVTETMYWNSFNDFKCVLRRTRNYVDKFEFYEKLIHKVISKADFPSDILKKITYLFDLGTNVNAKEPSNNSIMFDDVERTIIHNVCYLVDSHTHSWYKKRFIEELLNRGADVNSRDKYGRTPLYYLAINSDYSTMRFLLEKGADINAPFIENNNLLFQYTIHVVKNQTIYDNDKYKEMIKFLVKNGANINAKVKISILDEELKIISECNILHQLCTHLMETNIYQDDIDENEFIVKMVSTLIRNGADINSTVIIDNEIFTPLSIAVLNRNVRMVEVLLSYEPIISQDVIDFMEKVINNYNDHDDLDKRVVDVLEYNIWSLSEQPSRKRSRLC